MEDIKINENKIFEYNEKNKLKIFEHNDIVFFKQKEKNKIGLGRIVNFYTELKVNDVHLTPDHKLSLSNYIKILNNLSNRKYVQNYINSLSNENASNTIEQEVTTNVEDINVNGNNNISNKIHKKKEKAVLNYFNRKEEKNSNSNSSSNSNNNSSSNSNSNSNSNSSSNSNSNINLRKRTKNNSVLKYERKIRQNGRDLLNGISSSTYDINNNYVICTNDEKKKTSKIFYIIHSFNTYKYMLHYKKAFKHYKILFHKKWESIKISFCKNIQNQVNFVLAMKLFEIKKLYPNNVHLQNIMINNLMKIYKSEKDLHIDYLVLNFIKKLDVRIILQNNVLITNDDFNDIITKNKKNIEEEKKENISFNNTNYNQEITNSTRYEEHLKELPSNKTGLTYQEHGRYYDYNDEEKDISCYEHLKRENDKYKNVPRKIKLVEGETLQYELRGSILAKFKSPRGVIYRGYIKNIFKSKNTILPYFLIVPSFFWFNDSYYFSCLNIDIDIFQLFEIIKIIDKSKREQIDNIPLTKYKNLIKANDYTHHNNQKDEMLFFLLKDTEKRKIIHEKDIGKMKEYVTHNEKSEKQGWSELHKNKGNKYKMEDITIRKEDDKKDDVICNFRKKRKKVQQQIQRNKRAKREKLIMRTEDIEEGGIQQKRRGRKRIERKTESEKNDMEVKKEEEEMGKEKREEEKEEKKKEEEEKEEKRKEKEEKEEKRKEEEEQLGNGEEKQVGNEEEEQVGNEEEEQVENEEELLEDKHQQMKDENDRTKEEEQEKQKNNEEGKKENEQEEQTKKQNYEMDKKENEKEYETTKQNNEEEKKENEEMKPKVHNELNKIEEANFFFKKKDIIETGLTKKIEVSKKSIFNLNKEKTNTYILKITNFFKISENRKLKSNNKDEKEVLSQNSKSESTNENNQKVGEIIDTLRDKKEGTTENKGDINIENQNINNKNESVQDIEENIYISEENTNDKEININDKMEDANMKKENKNDKEENITNKKGEIIIKKVNIDEKVVHVTDRVDYINNENVEHMCYRKEEDGSKNVNINDKKVPDTLNEVIICDKNEEESNKSKNGNIIKVNIDDNSADNNIELINNKKDNSCSENELVNGGNVDENNAPNNLKKYFDDNEKEPLNNKNQLQNSEMINPQKAFDKNEIINLENVNDSNTKGKNEEAKYVKQEGIEREEHYSCANIDNTNNWDKEVNINEAPTLNGKQTIDNNSSNNNNNDNNGGSYINGNRINPCGNKDLEQIKRFIEDEKIKKIEMLYRYCKEDLNILLYVYVMHIYVNKLCKNVIVKVLNPKCKYVKKKKYEDRDFILTPLIGYSYSNYYYLKLNKIKYKLKAEKKIDRRFKLIKNSLIIKREQKRKKKKRGRKKKLIPNETDKKKKKGRRKNISNNLSNDNPFKLKKSRGKKISRFKHSYHKTCENMDQIVKCTEKYINLYLWGIFNWNYKKTLRVSFNNISNKKISNFDVYNFFFYNYETISNLKIVELIILTLTTCKSANEINKDLKILINIYQNVRNILYQNSSIYGSMFLLKQSHNLTRTHSNEEVHNIIFY
ncbi:hypothetical protein MKS88_005189 [Plasmodium brasilianum]|uniref:Uncharacterized protein n=1 Tax=Plasmodium brasilianum TaxID=5824 RepID=A0ACB9Y3G8_PLABR|nr:hypothetical protein MKS88_005189 [Plasmodium brasilianum]